MARYVVSLVTLHKLTVKHYDAGRGCNLTSTKQSIRTWHNFNTRDTLPQMLCDYRCDSSLSDSYPLLEEAIRRERERERDLEDRLELRERPRLPACGRALRDRLRLLLRPFALEVFPADEDEARRPRGSRSFLSTYASAESVPDPPLLFGAPPYCLLTTA